MLVVVTDEIATHLRGHNDARLNILYAQKLPFIHCEKYLGYPVAATK